VHTEFSTGGHIACFARMGDKKRVIVKLFQPQYSMKLHISAYIDKNLDENIAFLFAS